MDASFSTGTKDSPTSKPSVTTWVAKMRPLSRRLRGIVRSHEVFLVVAAIGVGIVAGALVAALSQTAQYAHVVIFGLPLDRHLSASSAVSPLAALTAPVGGGLLIGLMEAWRRRRGIPAAVDPVEANAIRGGRMSLRDSLIVAFQTLVSNGCGASVGLEAGYAQLGAGFASWVGASLKLRRNDLRTLVGSGAAGAIAAAFGAPFAGAFYAFELVIGVYSVGSIAPVIASSLSALITTQILGGSPYKIEVTASFALGPLHYLLFVLLGILCAGLGVAVMRSIALIERGFEGTRLPTALRPAMGGLIVGGLGLITPQVLAAGHGAMELDIDARMTFIALLSLIFLKLAASMISLGSGFRGGLFFASLLVGALIGKLFAMSVAFAMPTVELDQTAAVLVGMGAFSVAVIGAPLALTLLVLETTGNLSIGAGVLAACVASNLSVRSMFGYSFSTWRLHLQGKSIRSAHDVGWIRAFTVAKLMRGDPPTALADASINALRAAHPLGSADAIVLIEQDRRYAGIVTLPDAYAIDPEGASIGTARCLARNQDFVLQAEQNIKEAMAVFDRSESEALAVVDTNGCVIGLLREAYLTRRYAEELDKVNMGITG